MMLLFAKYNIIIIITTTTTLMPQLPIESHNVFPLSSFIWKSKAQLKFVKFSNSLFKTKWFILEQCIYFWNILKP